MASASGSAAEDAPCADDCRCSFVFSFLAVAEFALPLMSSTGGAHRAVLGCPAPPTSTGSASSHSRWIRRPDTARAGNQRAPRVVRRGHPRRRPDGRPRVEEGLRIDEPAVLAAVDAALRNQPTSARPARSPLQILILFTRPIWHRDEGGWWGGAASSSKRVPRGARSYLDQHSLVGTGGVLVHGGGAVATYHGLHG